MGGLNVGAQPAGYPADAFHHVLMSILVAAPFSVIMVLTVFATLKSLHAEHQRRLRIEEQTLFKDVEETALVAAQWANGAE